MPTFNDSESKPPRTILAEGDYIYTCTGWETSISKGKKTGGADVLNIELELHDKDLKPLGGVAFENLIDHASCAWKIDCFLKSAGVQLKKGQNFGWGVAPAGSQGLYVQPTGLRGWCKVGIESYTPSNAATDANGKVLPGQTKQKNVVLVFYTDRAKIAPDEALRARDAEEKAPF